MVEAQGEGLGEFITSHPKGKHVAPYLGEVTRLMRAEHDAIDAELRTLTDGIEHIRKLVEAQPVARRASRTWPRRCASRNNSNSPSP